MGQARGNRLTGFTGLGANLLSPVGGEGLQDVREVVALDGPEKGLEGVVGRFVAYHSCFTLPYVSGRQLESSRAIRGPAGELC